VRRRGGARDGIAPALATARSLAGLPGGAGAEERLGAVERLLRRGLPEAVPRIFPAAAAGLAASAAASRLLGTLAAPEELEAVRRGLPHNPTTEMDLALWGLAERARADPAAAEALAGSAPVELSRAYRAGSLPPTLQ